MSTLFTSLSLAYFCRMDFWKNLTTEAQLADIDQQSAQKPVLIFKHSTRCSVSNMVLDRLIRSWKPAYNEKLTAYYLDLLNYRSISNQLAEKYGVVHESPQVLLIENGVCTLPLSQGNIRLEHFLEGIEK